MSRKVLLVYDDYSEMIRTQTELVKIGFDIVGIVNETRMLDQLLIFNPDLVLTAGRGGKVSAVSVAQRLKDYSRYQGKVVLLLPPSQRPTAEELSHIRVDSILELPLTTLKLIQVLSKNLNLDSAALIEKYRKARISEGATEEELKSLRAALDAGRRRDRALKGIEIDPNVTSFSRNEIKNQNEKLKKDWDFNKLGEIDELKRKFAEALFKKDK